jgi:hypothetical protein
MSKNTSRSVCTSTILSANPSSSSVVKNPENTEEDLDDPELADKGDIQMIYCSD